MLYIIELYIFLCYSFWIIDLINQYSPKDIFPIFQLFNAL